MTASVLLAGAFPASRQAPGLGSAGTLAASAAPAPATKSVIRAGAHPKFAGAPPSAAAGGPPSGPPRTSCRSVPHIGDSTSEGLVSADYLPNPAKRMPERYEDAGVQTVRTDISGARSVVEVLPGQVNGYDAARAMVAAGFSG